MKRHFFFLFRVFFIEWQTQDSWSAYPWIKAWYIFSFIAKRIVSFFGSREIQDPCIRCLCLIQWATVCLYLVVSSNPSFCFNQRSCQLIVKEWVTRVTVGCDSQSYVHRYITKLLLKQAFKINTLLQVAYVFTCHMLNIVPQDIRSGFDCRRPCRYRRIEVSWVFKERCRSEDVLNRPIKHNTQRIQQKLQTMTYLKMLNIDLHRSQ